MSLTNSSSRHADFRRQLPRQRRERVRGAAQLELTPVHPTHEMMKMHAPGRYLEMPVEAIHQPGLAAPHRAPEIDPENGTAPGRNGFVVKRMKTGIEPLRRSTLGLIRGETMALHRLAVKIEWRSCRHVSSRRTMTVTSSPR